MQSDSYSLLKRRDTSYLYPIFNSHQSFSAHLSCALPPSRTAEACQKLPCVGCVIHERHPASAAAACHGEAVIDVSSPGLFHRGSDRTSCMYAVLPRSSQPSCHVSCPSSALQIHLLTTFDHPFNSPTDTSPAPPTQHSSPKSPPSAPRSQTDSRSSESVAAPLPVSVVSCPMHMCKLRVRRMRRYLKGRKRKSVYGLFESTVCARWFVGGSYPSLGREDSRSLFVGLGLLP